MPELKKEQKLSSVFRETDIFSPDTNSVEYAILK